MIKREKYLNDLRDYYDTKDIKIIKGVRRVGKTTLLNQIKEELNVDKEYIIEIDFDSFENSIYTNTALFTKYLKDRITSKNKYYLFIDEVQNLNDWDKIVYLFNEAYNISIFVTSSSSNIEYNLSSYKMVNLLPFTFKEYLSLRKGSIKKVFNEYLNTGGMPPIVNTKDDYSKKTTIRDIYNSIIVEDIVKRYSVKDVILLNKMIHYILQNINSVFSVNNMASYFETYDRKVSLDTMYNYLEYIKNSAMFSKIDRYNLNSNKILYGKYKYYVTDFSFLNIIDSDKDLLRYKLENVVCNELIYRGYDVKKAIVGTKEIDFIAIKGEEVIYIDILTNIEELYIKNIRKKFRSIKTNCKKYILSLDDIQIFYDDVEVKNIINFLLDK